MSSQASTASSSSLAAGPSSGLQNQIKLPAAASCPDCRVLLWGLSGDIPDTVEINIKLCPLHRDDPDASRPLQRAGAGALLLLAVAHNGSSYHCHRPQQLEELCRSSLVPMHGSPPTPVLLSSLSSLRRSNQCSRQPGSHPYQQLVPDPVWYRALSTRTPS